MWKDQCEANDRYSYFIQALLALVCFITLVVKYLYEEKRSFNVWLMDVSKEAIGLLSVHFSNLYLGVKMASFSGYWGASNCSWFFVNSTTTAFLGLIYTAAYISLLRWFVKHYDSLSFLRSGVYSPSGEPPRISWWMAQTCLWCVVCCGQSFVIATLVVIPAYAKIDKFMAWVETPFQKYPHVQVFLTMFLAPMIEDVIYTWCIDSLVMERNGGPLDPFLVDG